MNDRKQHSLKPADALQASTGTSSAALTVGGKQFGEGSV